MVFGDRRPFFRDPGSSHFVRYGAPAAEERCVSNRFV